MNLKEEIENYPNLFRKDGKLNAWCFRKGAPFLKSSVYKNIIITTSYLSNIVSIPERIYCVENMITSVVLCEICNTSVKFISSVEGYQTFCSSKCAGQSSKVKEKREKTCIKKYNTTNPSKTNNVIQKIKQTNLNNHNGIHNSQTKEYKKQVKETNLKRYNDENYNNRKKAKETMLNRYNVENASQSSIFREKSKQTCLDRYGVKYSLQNTEVKNKSKQTMLKKYGVDHNSKISGFSDIVKQTKFNRYGDATYTNREKSKQTCLDRYGVDNYNQIHLSKYTLEKLNNKEWLTQEHIEKEKPLTKLAEELNVTSKTVWNYFRKHDIDNHVFFQSYPEKQILKYVQEKYNTEVITNNRTIIKPYELDIYLPEYKLAIEYNGVYWHRPERYGSKIQWFLYHQNKEELCNLQGIKLLHIWENYKNYQYFIDLAMNGRINNELSEIYEKIFK